jgi:ArsR family transcriptional regulator, arsenate/arsenite/antimonite-responsive transcriptional repressor
MSMAGKKQQIELSDRQMRLIAKALADPHRYEILRKLGDERSTQCRDMLQCIDVSPATLSHHMKELESAGLIRSEKEGKFVRYFPKRRVVAAYLKRLKSELA